MNNDPVAKVLVAEDSATQREEIRFLLEESGLLVVVAADGREALALAESEDPDLIVSDVLMPGLTGFELTRAIRANPRLRRIPVILVTSLTSATDVFVGLECGADNFITKPYEEKHLLSRINYILANRELRKRGKLNLGIEIELGGERHFITAERQQILDLLISTYEQAVRLNEQVQQSHRQLSRSHEILDVLYRLALGLNACESEHDIYRHTLETVRDLPGVAAAWLLIRNEDDGFDTFGDAGPDGSAPSPSDIARLAALMNRAHKEPGATVAGGPEDGPGPSASRAIVPFTPSGHPAGVLEVVGTADAAFSATDVNTFVAVGQQVAVTMERVRLHRNLESLVDARTRALQSEMEERKTAEAAARMAEAQVTEVNDLISSILASSPAAIVTLDRDHNVLNWNRAAELIFGYSAREVAGAPFPLVSPDNGEGVQAVFNAVVSGERLDNTEARLLRKDGSEALVRLSGAPLYRSDGSIRGTTLVLEDLTERRSVEDQLRQAQKMEAIGNLTGGIAHDFNNLLTVVIGNLELVKLHLGENRKAHALADSALHGALRGAELTRQLLTFARKQSLEPRLTDVNELLSGITRLLGRTLGDHIEIDLGLCDAPWPVMVDPAQLDSAIMNLALNARDAMPEGGRLTLTTRNATAEEINWDHKIDLDVADYSVVEVTDTGSGIPAEVRGRIFDPFFTTKAAGKGTGLGLAMVYGFIKQSGGHVTVYSEAGHGTTFRLYLPRAGEDTAGGAEAQGRSLEVPIGSGQRVLVVEDNPALRDLVERHLTDLGYSPTGVSSAVEAVGMLEADSDFSLVLSDVVMPGGMSGQDLAKVILERWPSVRVLLTSGYTELAVRSGEALAAHVLSKPFRQIDLARKVFQVLNMTSPSR